VGCLFLLLGAAFPRAMLIIWWLARPDRVDQVFSTVIWPVLGIVFLPFATLMYALLYLPGDGVTGADWGWVALAAVFDVMHWGFTARQYRPVQYGDPI
jgi:amino acid transporter